MLQLLEQARARDYKQARTQAGTRARTHTHTHKHTRLLTAHLPSLGLGLRAMPTTSTSKPDSCFATALPMEPWPRIKMRLPCAIKHELMMLHAPILGKVGNLPFSRLDTASQALKPVAGPPRALASLTAAFAQVVCSRYGLLTVPKHACSALFDRIEQIGASQVQ